MGLWGQMCVWEGGGVGEWEVCVGVRGGGGGWQGFEWLRAAIEGVNAKG